MSGRGASAAVLTEIAKSANKPFHLCSMALLPFGGGALVYVYMTDAHRAVSFGGNSYLALGHFLTFSGLEEAAELKTTQASVSLAGVDQTLIEELQHAIDHIRTLKGILPICASCKKVRDDEGYWQQVESYQAEHTDVQFSHGICPDCIRRHYPTML